MTDQIRTETFTIPANKTGVVFRNIRKLNKKAAVDRAGKFEVELSNERTIKIESGESFDGNPVRVPVRVIDATITGPDFSIAGYELICLANFSGEIKQFSDFNDSEFSAYDEITTDCDHCNKPRNRNKIFILKNIESGEFIQVGKSCVKDFLGHNIFDAIKGAGFWGQIKDDCDEMFKGARSDSSEPLQYIVALAATVTRSLGYVSRAEADESRHEATADVVKELASKCEKVTDEERAEADAVIEWARSEFGFDYDDGQKNDSFTMNVSGILDAGRVPSKMTGFAACLPSLKSRAEAKAAIAESNELSIHFGEIKKRMNSTLEVLAVTYIDSDWGCTSLYTMKAGDNVVKWFSSRDVLEVGETYDVKMTVKKHDVFNGVNQTVVTRVAVQEAA